MTNSPTQPMVLPAASGYRLWQSGTQVRQIRLAFDDITRVHGDATYAQMLTDAQVAANMRLFKSAILEDGQYLTSAVADSDADGYDLAGELVGFVERTLSDPRESLDDALWSMLDALALGCTVSEITLRRERTYSGRMQVALDWLRPLPREQVGFGLDTFGRIIGIIARTASDDAAMTAPEVRLLPRDRFVVHAFEPRPGDPRGSSLLRSAHTAWDIKQRTWPEFYRYLVQFAAPSIVGFTPENPREVVQPDGTYVTATTALLQSLMAFQNGTALALEGGSDLKVLWSQGDGKAFLDAFAHCNREITVGMLATARATLEAEYGSRADSQSAGDVLGTLIRRARKALALSLRRDLLRMLVREQYGARAAMLTPVLSFGETEQVDVTPMMQAVAALERVGYLDPSQLPELDVQLGLTPRSADELAQRSERRAAPTPPPAPASPADPADDTKDDA